MHLQSALTILESPDNPTAGGAQFLRDLARLLNSLTSLSRVNSKPLPSVIHHIATPRSSIEGYVRFRKYQRSTRLAELHQWRYPLPLSKRILVNARGSLHPHSDLSHQLGVWNIHFSDFRAHSTVAVETTTCIQVLPIPHQMAKLYLLSELEHGIYAPRFSYPLERSGNISRAEEGRRAITIQSKRGHSLHTAITRPLFYTACQCKDRIIRRRATKLLTTVNGVLLYDTQLLARVAKRVVALGRR